MSCRPFSDARKSLLCFQVISIKERAIDFRFKSLSNDVFLCFAGLLCEDLLCIHRETG